MIPRPPAGPPPTTGPYRVEMQQAPGLPGSTLYRPEAPGPLPVVLWGAGACFNAGAMYRPFLTELASHGYLVLATGPPVELGLPNSKAEQMLKGVDWAVAQNARPGGPFAGRIDVSAIAAMGTSCGGRQAFWAAVNDPRITTVVLGNSGLSEKAGRDGLSIADIGRLKVPALYLVGGAQDRAYPAVEESFRRLTGVPAVKASLPVGHFQTWQQPYGGAFGRATIDWLDWRLKGSAQAAGAFTGPDCRLCRAPGWTVERKNIP